jgi:ApeA N-terminal domain 1
VYGAAQRLVVPHSHRPIRQLPGRLARSDNQSIRTSFMEDGFNVRGTWWLPERPSHPVPGVLKYSIEDGISLELFGSLRSPLEEGERREEDGVVTIDITEDSMEKSGIYPRLHGEANGTPYTLEDCFRTNWTAGLFGHGQSFETINVTIIYRGAIFEQGETIEGTGITFATDYLNYWIMESGIREEHSWSNTGEPLADYIPKVTLRGFDKPARKITTADKRTVRLEHHVGMSGDRIESRTLHQSFYWRIDTASGMAIIEDLLDWISDLQDLVSIATNRTSGFDFIQIWHPDVTRKVDKDRTIARPIDVFARWIAKSDIPLASLSRADLLFTFSDLGGMEGVKRWVDAAQKHRDSLGRATSSRYMKGTFVSDRLLGCAAALEAFDRASTGFEQSKFKTRLKRCASAAGHPFTTLVGDVESWAEQIRLERNDVAHHLGRRTRNTGSRTLYLWQSLYYLYVMCFLRSCGAPEVVFEQIQKCREYDWLGPRLRAII